MLSGFDFHTSCFDNEQIDIELQKKEEEKEELLLFGHKGSHIRLKNYKRAKICSN